MRLNIDQRQAGFVIATIMFGASLLALVSQFITTPNLTIIGITSLSAFLYGGISYALWKNQSWGPMLLVLITTALVILGLVSQVLITPVFLPSIFVPAVIAGITSGPLLVAFAGLAPFIAMNIALSQVPNNPYSESITIIVYVVIISGMVLARIVLDSTLRRMAHARDEAEATREKAIGEAARVREQAGELQRQYDEQQRLISLIDTLEVPTISLASGVLLAPIVGNLDSRRAARVTSTLLHAVDTQRARLVILDLAGVKLVDTQVAKAILDLMVAIKLLGCRVTLTGISSTVATTLTHLGIELSTVIVARDPQDALVKANLELHLVN